MDSTINDARDDTNSINNLNDYVFGNILIKLNTIIMKSTVFYKQCLVYIIFTSTLFLGLYFGEDIAGGAIYDYNIHKATIDKVFKDGLLYGLLNYQSLCQLDTHKCE